ncbi:hypothetical protein CKO36_01870 [Rhabdochromatium marinum]|nr:hypothetical protein [Rhabdochromatium marinum]
MTDINTIDLNQKLTLFHQPKAGLMKKNTKTKRLFTLLFTFGIFKNRKLSCSQAGKLIESARPKAWPSRWQLGL